jgi:hypothetical protein
MMDEPCYWTSSLDCHGERRDGEFGTQVIAHGPADHFAGEQVEDHGQVEPALASRDIGDIGQPDLIGSVGDKVLVQQVFRHRQGMLAVGGADAKAAWRPRPDAVLAHDPCDPLTADGMALGAQFGVNARRPVSFPVLHMDPPDIGQQLAVGDLARALRP